MNLIKFLKNLKKMNEHNLGTVGKDFVVSYIVLNKKDYNFLKRGGSFSQLLSKSMNYEIVNVDLDNIDLFTETTNFDKFMYETDNLLTACIITIFLCV